MTRAVTNLSIVLLFKDNNDIYTQFNSMKMEKKFIKCQKTFKKWNDGTFYCETCQTHHLCKTCAIGCHHEHNTKYEYSGYEAGKIAKDGTGKCNCINLNCSIQDD